MLEMQQREAELAAQRNSSSPALNVPSVASKPKLSTTAPSSTTTQQPINPTTSTVASQTKQLAIPPKPNRERGTTASQVVAPKPDSPPPPANEPTVTRDFANTYNAFAPHHRGLAGPVVSSSAPPPLISPVLPPKHKHSQGSADKPNNGNADANRNRFMSDTGPAPVRFYYSIQCFVFFF